MDKVIPGYHHIFHQAGASAVPALITFALVSPYNSYLFSVQTNF